MKREEKELNRLISGYINGTIDQQEREKLLLWMEQLEVSNSEALIHPGLKAELKARIDKQLFGTEKSTTAFITKIGLRWISVAAVFLLLLGVGSFHFLKKASDLGSPQLAIQQAEDFQIRVQKDSSFYLSDGSLAHLLAGSTLSWNSKYNTTDRALELHGTAFFKVKKDTLRPFSVLSNSILTTALGTEFWVSEYGKNTSVKLISGSVLLQRKNHAGALSTIGTLKPGEKWSMKKKRSAKEIKSEPETDLKHLKSALRFENAALSKVFKELESNFHVKFQIDADVEVDMTFYGTFGEDDQLVDILEIISLANDLKFEDQGHPGQIRVLKIK